MKVQLTDRFCAHAKSLGEPQTDYFDETVRGLALRVTSGGTKAWTFLHGSPRRRVTLGRYPAISLASARALALETKEGRPQVMNVAALTDIYVKSLKGKRSFRQVERLLRRDVVPIIGSIPLSELHRRDVTRVVDAKAAPIAARRAFDQLRAMIRWAVARGDLDHNPIDGMKGPAASKPRERVLTQAMFGYSRARHWLQTQGEASVVRMGHRVWGDGRCPIRGPVTICCRWFDIGRCAILGAATGIPPNFPLWLERRPPPFPSTLAASAR